MGNELLIAVISDTHRVAKYINIAKEYIKSADVLIHLGDNSEDIEELTKGFKGKVYGVRGNCDFTNNYPKESIIVLEGKKIFITHGDLYGVKLSLTSFIFPLFISIYPICLPLNLGRDILPGFINIIPSSFNINCSCVCPNRTISASTSLAL